MVDTNNYLTFTDSGKAIGIIPGGWRANYVSLILPNTDTTYHILNTFCILDTASSTTSWDAAVNINFTLNDSNASATLGAFQSQTTNGDTTFIVHITDTANNMITGVFTGPVYYSYNTYQPNTGEITVTDTTYIKNGAFSVQVP